MTSRERPSARGLFLEGAMVVLSVLFALTVDSCYERHRGVLGLKYRNL